MYNLKDLTQRTIYYNKTVSISSKKNLEFTTQAQLIDNKDEVIENCCEEGYLMALNALRCVPKVKFIEEKEFKALWESDNPNYTRYYSVL